MMVRLVDTRCAAELLRRHGAIATLAVIVILAFAALAAIGAIEHSSDQARAGRTTMAEAAAQATAILDRQQRILDQLAAAAAFTSDDPAQLILRQMLSLAPGSRAAAFYDPAGMPLLRNPGDLDGTALATLGTEAAAQARNNPGAAMLVTPAVRADHGDFAVVGLAQAWVAASGEIGGIVLIAVDRSAFAGLDLIRDDGAPLFAGADEPVIAGTQHLALGKFPLQLRHTPVGPTPLRGAWPFVAIAVIGVTGALSLLALLIGRLHTAERESAHHAAIEGELNQQLAAVVAAAERASEIGRVKSEFFAQVTHELRTPLNAILGFSEAIEDEMFGPVTNSRYRDYAGLIRSAGSHLLSLIDDLLANASIEAGKMEVVPARIAASALAHSALDLVTLLAQKRDITVNTAGLATCPELNVDPRAMKQVLLNLLSNAVKYTPSGGQISLGFAAREDGGITIEVADTGIGMSAEDLRVAFEPFGRSTAVVARRQQGTGLGLSLARALVRLHGGELTLTSRVDHGTTATVILPPSAVLAGPEARRAPPAKNPDAAAA